MVRPTSFAFNPETAATNGFSTPGDPLGAGAEFNSLVAALIAQNIDVRVWEGPLDAPDAVFPNNWISSHEDGRVVVYPMASESRRRERQNFEGTCIDLTGWESEGKFLEGTGSLVLDRANKTAYASLSPRTHPDAVRDWCAGMGYWPIVFEAFDRAGAPIYHTNVVLSVGSDWAVICSRACPSPNPVLAELKMAGKNVIDVDFDQLEAFCGNVIELDGVIVTSSRAWAAFSIEQRAVLGKNRAPVVVDIGTIEAIGGGSVRCMIAEWFAPFDEPVRR
jgi:hypothetical protein